MEYLQHIAQHHIPFFCSWHKAVVLHHIGYVWLFFCEKIIFVLSKYVYRSIHGGLLTFRPCRFKPAQLK